MTMWSCFSDSVEEGEKLVKTALDNFGRIGEFINSIYLHWIIRLLQNFNCFYQSGLLNFCFIPIIHFLSEDHFYC